MNGMSEELLLFVARNVQDSRYFCVYFYNTGCGTIGAAHYWNENKQKQQQQLQIWYKREQKRQQKQQTTKYRAKQSTEYLDAAKHREKRNCIIYRLCSC